MLTIGFFIITNLDLCIVTSKCWVENQENLARPIANEIRGGLKVLLKIKVQQQRWTNIAYRTKRWVEKQNNARPRVIYIEYIAIY